MDHRVCGDIVTSLRSTTAAPPNSVTRGVPVEPDSRGLLYRALDPQSAHLYRLLGCWPATTVDVGVIAAVLDCTRDEAERSALALQAAGALHAAGTRRWSRDLVVQAHQQSLAGDVAAADVGAVRRRIGEFYWAWASEADRILGPHHDQRSAHIPSYRPTAMPRFDAAAALDWIEAEADNVVVAARGTLVAGYPLLAWELLDRLKPVLSHRRSKAHDAGDWLFLTAAETVGEAALIAVSMTRLGVTLQWSQRFSEAVQVLARARDIWGDLGERGNVADVGTQIALVHLAAGNARAAVAQLRRRLASQESIGSPARTVALVRVELAAALLATNTAANAPLAREQAAHAWQALTELPDRFDAARAQVVLGRAHAACAWGDDAPAHLSTAQELIEQALDQLREIGAHGEVAEALMALAPVEQRRGALRARALYTEAGEIFRRLGSSRTTDALRQRAALPAVGTGR